LLAGGELVRRVGRDSGTLKRWNCGSGSEAGFRQRKICDRLINEAEFPGRSAKEGRHDGGAGKPKVRKRVVSPQF